jgi:DNA-binding transcriptional LysR family regulator
LTLFKKKGPRVYLTQEGRILYDHACKVFEYEKEIENAIDSMRKLTLGMLRVGATKTYARFIMPSIVSCFHKAHPHIKINLDEGNSRDMILSLLEFRNDVAVVARALDHEDVSFIPFRQEELILILSPSHPLAGCKNVSFDQLANEPILMKDSGSGTSKAVNALFDAHRCVPNVLLETSNTELIKQLVQQGEGVSFLVRAAVAQEIAEQKLTTVQLKGEQLTLDVSIAYLMRQQLPPPAQAFVDMLQILDTSDMPPRDIGALMGKILASKAHKL